MPEYKFRLRDDMPRGFRENRRYSELPAAVAFLGQYEGQTFESLDVFRAVLGLFPEYLSKERVPESSDKALRAGLFLEETEIDSVFNVLTKSNEGATSECWFGSFGPEDKITEYFTAQGQARRRASLEDDA